MSRHLFSGYLTRRDFPHQIYHEVLAGCLAIKAPSGIVNYSIMEQELQDVILGDFASAVAGMPISDRDCPSWKQILTQSQEKSITSKIVHEGNEE